MVPVVSALVVLSLFLAAWFALCVLSLPILVLAVRSRARTNARVTRGLERRVRAARRG